VYDLGFEGSWVLDFGISGLGFRVKGFMVKGSGGEGLGFSVYGLACRV